MVPIPYNVDLANLYQVDRRQGYASTKSGWSSDLYTMRMDGSGIRMLSGSKTAS
jgi:hypothetical protein